VSAAPEPFQFAHRIDFVPANADELLRSVPAAPGVFALRGEAGEPYLTRTADLRRRLRRLLAPPEALDDSGNPVLSKRLNLRDRVRSIAYTPTGSEFESTLLLYRATRAAFGPEETRRRLRLHTPYMLRITLASEHPRLYTTNRLSQRALPELFGPFASRAAAERACDAALDLFQLRRCYEDLVPSPEHPGCVYGEMNKCLRPCQQACTPAEYAAESARVHAFFATRGQSLLDEVATQREAASDAMDFERAAELHRHWEKVRAAALLLDELIGPVAALRALVLQTAAQPEHETSTADAAVFLLEHGRLAGPARLSTLGVRAVREQTAVGSSLFAQPLMLAPVPLDETNAVILSEAPQRSAGAQSKEPEGAQPTATAGTFSTLTPEDRARAVLAQLSAQTEAAPDIGDLCDALSLFRRWYYRPEKQRAGEVFLPVGSPKDRSQKDGDPSWPIRRILNGAARVVLGPPAEAPPVDREAAKALKTKVLHAGREGVERVVPVLDKRHRNPHTLG